MKSILTRLLGPMLGLSLCLLPASALAAINLPFSTTYNCAEQLLSVGWSCDGLSSAGSWTTGLGAVEQITSPANYPGGAGGRGQRHWIGSGTNNNSGPIAISFSAPAKEVYIRWYVRFQQGLAMSSSNGSHKFLYFNGSYCQGHSSGCYFYMSHSEIRLTVSGYNFSAGTGYGWNALNGGANSSDGNWKCMEVHVKTNSSPGVNDGIAQWWVNGVLRLDKSNVDYLAPGNGFGGFSLPSNGVWTTVGGKDMFEDIDDVAISKTGRIGCTGATPPAAPQNLQLTP